MMTTATESPTKLFEETFDCMRKSTESFLEIQKEMYGKWTKMWPTMPESADWTAKKEKFTKEWTAAVSELMQKQREVVDGNYRAGIETLQEAFHVCESESPEELRDRYESYCRKMLELMKSTSEMQVQQFQEAMNKWLDVCQTKP